MVDLRGLARAADALGLSVQLHSIHCDGEQAWGGAVFVRRSGDEFDGIVVEVDADWDDPDDAADELFCLLMQEVASGKVAPRRPQPQEGDPE